MKARNVDLFGKLPPLDKEQKREINNLLKRFLDPSKDHVSTWMEIDKKFYLGDILRYGKKRLNDAYEIWHKKNNYWIQPITQKDFKNLTRRQKKKIGKYAVKYGRKILQTEAA